MADYIRRDIVLQIINTAQNVGSFVGYADYSAVFDEIDTMPAADVKRVKRGRWIRIIGALYECTECKAKLWLGSMNPADKYHYCWMCGAKMDLPEPPKEVD